MINGLIEPSGGEIYIQDKNINSVNPIRLRRNIGYVIQQTGLFQHMTVRENIEIVAKLEGKNPKAIKRKTKELMEMVGMAPQEYLDSYPSELSGGQQQRIGVARAFSLDPDIILMDEPFSALDPVTRSQLQEELMEIQRKTKKTIVFVTHDMDEAVRIADRICILQNGNIVQYDTPEQILKNPANQYIKEFVGTDRIWSAPELLRVKDIMISDVVTGSAQVSVYRALRRMYSRKVNSLVITDRNGKVVGVLLTKLAAQLEDKNQLVSEVMITDFEYALPEQPLLDVLPTVSVKNINSIPVLNQDKTLAGLITQSSLTLALSVPYVDTIELDFSDAKEAVVNVEC